MKYPLAFENDVWEVMRARHSVRNYLDRPIPAGTREILDSCVKDLNAASGLDMTIVYDEPVCFGKGMARYGSFENCSNYIALIGEKREGLERLCGEYGEWLEGICAQA